MFNTREMIGKFRFSYKLLTALPYTLLGLLSSLYLVQSSGVIFAFMEHRLTYEDAYTVGFNITPIIILLAAICFVILCISSSLLSLSSLTCLFLYPIIGLNLTLALASLLLVSFGVYKLKILREFLTILLISLSIVYLSSLIYWLIFYPLGWPYPLNSLVTQESFLYYITAPLSMFGVVSIVIASLYKPLTLFRREPIQKSNPTMKLIDRRIIFFLCLIIGLGVLAAIYPNLPGVNPESLNIGTDVMHYVPYLDQVNKDITQITTVYSGSRPLFFVLLMGFQRLLGLNSYWAVSLFPAVIVPLLTLSIFFLGREVTGDSECALWASFFTVAGFQTVAGLYGFLLADMLALAFAFITITMFFKWIDSMDWRYLVGTIFFGVALLYTHPWTFYQYIPVLALTALPLLLRSREKRTIVLMFAFVIIMVAGFAAIEVIHSNILGGVEVLEALKTLNRVVTLDSFLDSIIKSIFYFSGTIANIALLSLVVLGLLKHELNGTPRLYFTIFPFVTSLVFLIVDVDTKSRILFNFPFGIFAAIGMIEYRKVKDVNLKKILPIFIILLLLAYQLRSLANLI